MTNRRSPISRISSKPERLRVDSSCIVILVQFLLIIPRMPSISHHHVAAALFFFGLRFFTDPVIQPSAVSGDLDGIELHSGD